VIGGGYGVTAVHAARESTSGEISVYEGSESQVETIKYAIQQDGVDGRVEVIHGVISENVSVYDNGKIGHHPL